MSTHQDHLDPWMFVVVSSGRHQAAVCELDGFMYAIGGAESWNCLNSVERYNPDNNTWTLIAPMNVARRGAGVTVYEGNLCPLDLLGSLGLLPFGRFE